MFLKSINFTAREKLRQTFCIARAKSILASTLPTKTERAEQDFERLQEYYPPPPPYGYDPYSSWIRATARFDTLLKIEGLQAPGLRVLEVGCGDGSLGAIMDLYGHDVTLVDMEDWREKRATNIEFQKCDICLDSQPFDDNTFDLVVSYNTFEHVQNPSAALNAILQMCRPGGYIYLDFAPLYCSAYGLHAHRTLNMPFPQFLFSEEFLGERLRQFGIHDLGRERSTLQYVNKWKHSDYTALFASGAFSTLRLDVDCSDCFIDIIRDYPESFRGRRLTLNDVRAVGIRTLLQKAGL